MDETEANLSRRQKKARNKSEKLAEPISMSTPANVTAESIFAMSNGFTSPSSMGIKANVRSGDYQIAMLENLEGD